MPDRPSRSAVPLPVGPVAALAVTVGWVPVTVKCPQEASSKASDCAIRFCVVTVVPVTGVPVVAT
ncbi:MAG: hypothetical protein KIC89_12015 [Acetobacteraceae bacterium]|nr:hypothetical protein [Acetobacteraceae bacterium]